MASDLNIYATFNIGLDSKGSKPSLSGRLANIKRAVSLLADKGDGLKLQVVGNLCGPDEPFIVIQLVNPKPTVWGLTLDSICFACAQDCVAIHLGDMGRLVGPGAAGWGAFDYNKFTFYKE